MFGCSTSAPNCTQLRRINSRGVSGVAEQHKKCGLELGVCASLGVDWRRQKMHVVSAAHAEGGPQDLRDSGPSVERSLELDGTFEIFRKFLISDKNYDRNREYEPPGWPETEFAQLNRTS